MISDLKIDDSPCCTQITFCCLQLWSYSFANTENGANSPLSLDFKRLKAFDSWVVFPDPLSRGLH